MKKTSYRYGLVIIGDREGLLEIQSQLNMIIPESCRILKEVMTGSKLDFREISQD